MNTYKCEKAAFYFLDSYIDFFEIDNDYRKAFDNVWFYFKYNKDNWIKS